MKTFKELQEELKLKTSALNENIKIGGWIGIDPDWLDGRFPWDRPKKPKCPNPHCPHEKPKTPRYPFDDGERPSPFTPYVRS